MEELKVLKEIAGDLKEKGYTMNIYYDGKMVIRIGKDASSGLLSLFGPIEVKDLKTMLKLIED